MTAVLVLKVRVLSKTIRWSLAFLSLLISLLFAAYCLDLLQTIVLLPTQKSSAGPSIVASGKAELNWTRLKESFSDFSRTKAPQLGIEKQENVLVMKNPLTVLFWSSDEHANSWQSTFRYAQKQMESCLGPFKRQEHRKPACVATLDKNLIESADALLYNGPNERGGPFTPRSTANRHQIRIFFAQEAPFWFGRSMKIFPQGFNWTMTYRQDSDVDASYGSFDFLPLTTPTTLEFLWEDEALRKHEIKVPSKKLTFYKRWYINRKSKTNLVAWTASHCKTYSKREKLVEKLQRFVLVDTYGECGALNCTAPRYGEIPWQSCYAELGAKYKFYLSFENNLCEDYVTEKFFLALENNMVPIVYGSADYAKLAPPGSYINAMDFPSIKMLAKYIKFLHKNQNEYLKYFLWNEKYRIVYPDIFCSMCEALWRHAYRDPASDRDLIDPKYSKTVSNVTQWFYYRKNETFQGDSSKWNQACEIPDFSKAKNFMKDDETEFEFFKNFHKNLHTQ